MKYTLYLRDWYYNAGIVGFLNVIGENEKDIEKIEKMYGKSLEIGDNYVSFTPDILKDFVKKYEKISFLNFFDSSFYEKHSQSLIEELNEKSSLKKSFDKKPNLYKKLIVALLGEQLEKLINSNDIEKFIKKIENLSFTESNKEKIYETLKSKGKNGENFIESIYNFISEITDFTNLEECVSVLIKGIEPEEKSINNVCLFCNTYRKKYDLNTSISRIIGFNPDNSNWIWGFYSSKVRICPLCNLVLMCVPNGLVFLQREVSGELKSFFYFLNRNSNVKNLYENFLLFKKALHKNVREQRKPFYIVTNEIVYQIVKAKSQRFHENINFIEISEISKDQHNRKNFNIYNYNISPSVANFISNYLEDNLPKGYYKIEEAKQTSYFDISEELLKKTINETLGYEDLFRYYNIYLKSLKDSKKYTVNFNLKKLSNYVLIFINSTRREDMEDIRELEKIISKAYFNGQELANKIGQENKIRGIAYQLLNDLRVGDKEAFLDKYLRLVISYSSESKLGSNNELSDMDKFLSFGYSFINGLLSYLSKEDK